MPIFPALFAAAFLSTLVMRMTDPLVPVLSLEFGVSHGDIALLTTAYALPYGLFQVVLGPLGDRFGKTTVIKIALIALGLTILAQAAAQSFTALFAARAFAGMVGGGIIPLGLASIGDLVPMEKRQASLAKFMLASITGQVTGALMTGLAAEVLPWRGIFVGYALLAFVIAAMLFTAPKIPPVAGASASPLAILRRYRLILQRPMARLVLSIVFCEGMLFYGYYGQLAPYLAEVWGYSSGDIGLAVGAIGLGGALFSFSYQLSIRWLGSYGMMILGGCAGALAVVLTILPLGILGYGALAALAGYGFYSLHNNLQTRATEMAPEARGAAVSMFASLLFIGNGVGPFVLGLIIPFAGYGATFAAAALGIAALGTTAALAFHRLERVKW